MDIGVFDVATKSPEIKIPGGKSDKTLIQDLSTSGEKISRTNSPALNHQISQNVQIPVVYSKPAKHHIKVEVPNHSDIDHTSSISIQNISSNEKHNDLNLPLIEEM